MKTNSTPIVDSALNSIRDKGGPRLEIRLRVGLPDSVKRIEDMLLATLDQGTLTKEGVEAVLVDLPSIPGCDRAVWSRDIVQALIMRNLGEASKVFGRNGF